MIERWALKTIIVELIQNTRLTIKHSTNIPGSNGIYLDSESFNLIKKFFDLNDICITCRYEVENKNSLVRTRSEYTDNFPAWVMVIEVDPVKFDEENDMMEKLSTYCSMVYL